ncbi:hypothetical protein V8F20_007292 [Naviculisporaceae sp. PSN 640]
MLNYISSHLAFVFFIVPRTSKAFSHGWCKGRFEEKIAQNQTTINGKSIYFTTSTRGNDSDITYDACKAICGSHDNSIVNDWAVRLCSWVLPIIILTFTVQLPPLARRQKLWAVMRLMGDPIGSLLWITKELRFYDYCLAEGAKTTAQLENPVLEDEHAKNGTLVVISTGEPGDQAQKDLARNFARIFHASSKSNPGRDPREIRELLGSAMSAFSNAEERKRALEEIRKQVNEYGPAIAALKSRSTLRSLVAVGCFLFPVVIALVPALSPPASGGMLPPILILSPLLLIVLLNGAIGEYSNLWSLSRVLREVQDKILACLPEQSREGVAAALSPTVRREDMDLLTYTQISMTEPPRMEIKKGRLSALVKRHVLEGILLLIFPLGTALAGVAIGTAPTFLNDRHFVLVAIFVAWMGSWGVTWLVKDRERRVLRLLVVVTHFAVAFLVVALLAATTCGWLGGCKMWTGYYRYGPGEARMPLNLTEIFNYNGNRVYPALATVCLFLNLAAFICLRFWVLRDPFSVITSRYSKAVEVEAGLELA